MPATLESGSTKEAFQIQLTNLAFSSQWKHALQDEKQLPRMYVRWRPRNSSPVLLECKELLKRLFIAAITPT